MVSTRFETVCNRLKPSERKTRLTDSKKPVVEHKANAIRLRGYLAAALVC